MGYLLFDVYISSLVCIFMCSMGTDAEGLFLNKGCQPSYTNVKLNQLLVFDKNKIEEAVTNYIQRGDYIECLEQSRVYLTQMCVR